MIAPSGKLGYTAPMQMKELPKKYNHKEAEKRWQQHWFASDVYAWQDDRPREQTFVIDTPPPTVSGLLHMGHVFSYTQCDFVARYQRMKGMDVFYPMGFDDNGLPTERLVEKVKKIKAHQFIKEHGREAFVEVCDEVAEGARRDFRALFQSIALSVDWKQEYHTISPEVRRLSQLSFLDLFHKGYAERRLEPMLWDPIDQTAIAQAEVEDKELESSFNDITFGIEGSEDTITIGTTRPELIPACVAIFYHPEDERYQHLKGRQAITPLFGVKVPILEDDTVETDKGTGIMMCCTFGDEADIEKWRRHKLPIRVVINKYGKMEFALFTSSRTHDSAEGSQEIPLASDDAIRNDVIETLQGKKASNKDKNHPGAREIILELLKESGDLVDQKPITHAVKCAERSGAALELIPTHQWFVKVLDKKEALKAKADASTWYPDWMRVRMDQWIDGLNWDWCISRQRYFGVPFPVWYSKREGEEGHMIFAEADELPINPLITPPRGYTMDEVEPEPDVMDTWATSSITPQINAKGIRESDDTREDRMSDPALSALHREGQQAGAGSLTQKTESRFTKLFPADLRPQAHEIIRTWAFYTIVKAHLHSDSVPWQHLMISGWCLAEDKTKMSKSKGNVVTPVELIEEKGTDAVRYWAATSRLGQDTAFSTDLLKIGNKLVTKLWNATKFAAIHLEKLDETPPAAKDDAAVTEALDHWIITRLQRAVKKSTEAFEHYEYADALRATEDFFWNDFCDNYLELVKKRAYDEAGDNPAGQISAVHTIYHCLDGILRLFAPFVPHITEELFSHIFVGAYEAIGSLHARGMWPKAEDYLVDETAEQSGIAAVEILEAIRKAKSEKGVSIKYPIERIELTAANDTVSWDMVEKVIEDITSAGNVSELRWGDTPLSDNAVTSEPGRFSLAITFAKQAETAA